MGTKFSREVILLFAVSLLATCQSYGANVYWQGPAGGNYTTAANWSNNAVPSNSGFGQIISTANHCVINSAAVGPYIEIGGNDGSSGPAGYLDITVGASFTVYNSLYVALGGDAAVTMNGGTVNVASATYVGRTSSTGTLTMTGGHWITSQAYVALDELSTGHLVLGGNALFEVTTSHFYFDDWAGEPSLGNGTVEINGNAQLIIHDTAGPNGWRAKELMQGISEGKIFTSDDGKIPTLTYDPVTSWITLASSPRSSGSLAFIWGGGGPGNLWSTFGNWNFPLVPTSIDSVTISLPSSTCLIDSSVSDAACTDLIVGSSGNTGNLDITGGQLNVNYAGIGFGGTGIVTMSGGTANVATYTYIGRLGAIGTLTVTGGHWTTSQAYLALNAGDTGHLVLGGNGIFEVTTMHFYMDSQEMCQGTGTVEINGNAQLIIHDGLGGWRASQLNTAILAGRITTTDHGYAPIVIVDPATGWVTLKVAALPVLSCAELVAAGFGDKTDFNNDCHTNLEDLSVLASHWLMSPLD
jgi:hypothetical protein